MNEYKKNLPFRTATVSVEKKGRYLVGKSMLTLLSLKELLWSPDSRRHSKLSSKNIGTRNRCNFKIKVST